MDEFENVFKPTSNIIIVLAMMQDREEPAPAGSFSFNLFAGITVIYMFSVACLSDTLYEIMSTTNMWRLFMGFLGGPYQVFFHQMIVLMLIISLINLKSFLPRNERIYSTVYAITDIFIHQFILQFIQFPWVSTMLTIAKGQAPLMSLFSQLLSHQWEAQGWLALTQVFLIRRAQEGPEQMGDYMFIPMKRKFVPWIHLMFTMMVFQMKSPMLYATALGYLAAFLRSQNVVFRLPLPAYGLIQKFTPKAIKTADSFVLIQHCHFDQLKSKCTFCQIEEYDEDEEDDDRPSNPFLRERWNKPEEGEGKDEGEEEERDRKND